MRNGLLLLQQQAIVTLSLDFGIYNTSLSDVDVGALWYSALSSWQTTTNRVQASVVSLISNSVCTMGSVCAVLPL